MGLITLLLQCAAMAAASLVVGSIPLVLSNKISGACGGTCRPRETDI